MKKSLIKLNVKCIRTFGYTLKQVSLMVGIAAFVALWLIGSLPNTYEYMLSH
jgi:hypothetical protein